jgi:hypothetical protein
MRFFLAFLATFVCVGATVQSRKKNGVATHNFFLTAS